MPKESCTCSKEFCPIRRAAEKQAARDADAKFLADGGDPEVLRKRNGLFAFPNTIIRWDLAKPLK